MEVPTSASATPEKHTSNKKKASAGKSNNTPVASGTPIKAKRLPSKGIANAGPVADGTIHAIFEAKTEEKIFPRVPHRNGNTQELCAKIEHRRLMPPGGHLTESTDDNGKLCGYTPMKGSWWLEHD
jgi:hypothetical protein